KTEVNPALIDKLVRRVGVADRAQQEQLRYKLRCTIPAYRARILAGQEERPARQVAALNPGLKLARDGLAWLDSLPMGVLTGSQAGDTKTCLEALVARIENRVAYWQRHVKTHRPAGEGAVGLDLRRSLTAIITAHWPDPPDATEQQKRFKEQRRRDWVAFACDEIDAKYPHQKKHRRRFVGEHERSAGAWSADVYTTLPDELRFVALGLPLVASEAEERLRGVPI